MSFLTQVAIVPSARAVHVKSVVNHPFLHLRPINGPNQMQPTVLLIPAGMRSSKCCVISSLTDLVSLAAYAKAQQRCTVCESLANTVLSHASQ